MKIKLLDIRGFGRFLNRKIVPGEGFNLIYGSNESGKSTMAEFIGAMLFGIKAGKKAGGSGTLKSLKPWKADSFAGVMEYVLDDGSFFRIDRNFGKGTVHIHDGSARDITAQFALDRDTGPRFAEAHLNLTQPVFEKSALIRQMQSSIDDAGREALLQKLANLNASGSEDLSVTKALEALNLAMLEKVGTDRSTTRPLDKIQARLSELEEQKARILAQNERYHDILLLLKSEKEKLNRLNLELDELTRNRAAQLEKRILAIKAECLDQDTKLDRIRNEIQRVELRLKNDSCYGEMTELTIENLNTCLFSYREGIKRLADSNLDLANLMEKEASLKVNLKVLTPLKEKVERIERVFTEQNNTRDEAAYGNETRSKPAPSRLIPFVLLILSAAGVAFSVLLPGGMGLIPVVLSIVLFLAGILTLAVRNGKRSGKSGNNGVLLEKLIEEGFSGPDDYYGRKSDLKNIISSLEACENGIAETEKRIGSLNDVNEELLGKIGMFLGPVKLMGWEPQRIEDAIESFKTGYHKYREISASLNLLEQDMEACIEKRSLLLREASALAGKDIGSTDELITTASGMAAIKTDYPGSSFISRAELENQIRMKVEEIKTVEIDIKAQETKLENVPSLEALAGMDEESEDLKERKQRLEEAGKGILLAADILKEVSQELQKNYTPGLNREMSRLIAQITEGRYNSIKTDANFRLHLEVPESEELMPISRLSGGTIDQVYLAMRLSAVTLMERGKETIPIFLDEPFSQYDEERAERALLLLKETSINRQVFFLTCRHREMELAQNIWGDNLNLIRL